jgi:hypothetical protein
MEPISLQRLQTDLEAALSLWHEPALAGSPLDYLSLVRLATTTPALSRRAHNQVLLEALEQLQLTKPQSTELLRLRYLEKRQVAEVALHLNIVENTFYVRKPVALRHLAEVVLEREQDHRAARRHHLEARLLPPTYGSLVGVARQVERVSAALSRPEAPWVVVVAGLGGIGKTALADRVVRLVLEAGSFGEVAWVSAGSHRLSLTGKVQVSPEAPTTIPALIESLLRQVSGAAWVTLQSLSTEEMLASLHERFKAVPHLVVIDNLETVEAVEHLLPLLRRLMNPTKFIVTSRHTPVGEPDVYQVPVTELTQADALILVREEARTRNLTELATAQDPVLAPLYGVAGGNPLALRLLVGQLQVFDLEVVVANLAQAQGAGIEALYTYIYWQAWNHLSEPARYLFLTTPLLPVSGGTLARMLEVSQLDPAVAQAALHQLVQFNLVEARGTPGARHYTIHSLTRSFLQEQVARW